MHIIAFIGLVPAKIAVNQIIKHNITTILLLFRSEVVQIFISTNH